MNTSREEAFLFFRKWLNEGSWLLCMADVGSAPLTMNCRIVELSESEVRVESDENRVIGFTLPPRAEFWFAEPSSFPTLQEQISVALSLAVFTPDGSKQTSVVFCELKNGPIYLK